MKIPKFREKIHIIPVKPKINSKDKKKQNNLEVNSTEYDQNKLVYKTRISRKMKGLNTQ